MDQLKKILSKKKLGIFIGVLLVIVIAIVIPQFRTESIMIGFVADLTGQKSELGVQTRNGVQLAIEKINAEGGINGHEIKLIIKDDKGTEADAKKADQELIDENVVAIIGHVTSAQTLYGMEVTEKNNVLLVGPTISTPLLSGKDDYFVRVYPSFEKSALSYADYVYREAKKNSMVIIYDTDNAAYSKTYCDIFSEEYSLQGGKVLAAVPYSSSELKNFTPVIRQCMELKPEGFLIIASDVDTAFIAQRSRVLGWEVQFFSTAWAQSQTLISGGGKAVEGMITEQAYPIKSSGSDLSIFEKEYKDRFGSEPYFSSAGGYEAAIVLAEALKATDGKRYGLKEALLNIKDFQGISDKLSFDRYGDVERPFYLSEVKNHTFTVIKRLTMSK